MITFDNSGKFFVQNHTGENVEFVNRQKNVFEKLDAVAKDKEKSVIKQITSQSHATPVGTKSHKKHKTDTRQFRGQESIFKRPEAPPPSRFKRNIPDYQRHPKKWTKYTLSDVSQEDMSDRSNTAAAMSFLQELKAKKESETMDVDDELKQITFKKPSNYRKRDSEAASNDKFESSSFRSSKVIMPEYVVGEKKIPKRTTITPIDKLEKTKEVKLDHLNEEEDEC